MTTATPIPSVRAAIEQREQRDREQFEQLQGEYVSHVFALATEGDAATVDAALPELLDELGISEERLVRDVAIMREVPEMRETAAKLAELVEAHGRAREELNRYERESKAKREQLWRAVLHASSQQSLAAKASDRLRDLANARRLLFQVDPPTPAEDVRVRAQSLASAEGVDLAEGYRRLFRLVGEPEPEPAKAQSRPSPKRKGGAA